jgi:hypothetical protein
VAIARDGHDIAHPGIVRLPFAVLGKARLEGLDQAGRRAHVDHALIGIEQERVAIAHLATQRPHAAHHRNAHRPRHDHDMGGQRAFLEDHPLEAAAVVFEQFGRAQIARDQDRVGLEPHRRGRAQLARDDPQQAVRQVFKVVHAVGEQRIVDLAHPHAGVLLDALDGGLGGEAGIDRLVDAAAPAFVVGEHPVGFEHFLMLAPDAEFGLAGHAVDLLAHAVEGAIDPLALGLGVFGHDMLDHHARLVEHRLSDREALDQRLPAQAVGADQVIGHAQHVLVVDQFGVGDQFGQNHRHGLQGLDLDLFIAALVDMLDRHHPHRTLAPHDRHARERMEALFAGFRAEGEIGMGGSLGEIERLAVLGNRADKALAHGHARDMDGGLFEPAGGEEFEHPLAQEVDRADLAVEVLADHVDDAIELGLGSGTRGHDLVQGGQDRAGRGNSRHHGV